MTIMQKHCDRTVRSAVAAVIGAACLLAGAEVRAGDLSYIEGVVQVITPQDGQSYFAVDIGQEIEAVSDAGGIRKGRVLQIAGLDESLLKKAEDMVGSRVRIEGRAFGAFTVHHYTEVLWLATGIKKLESDVGKTAPN